MGGLRSLDRNRQVLAPQFSLPSYAKINWSLRILGKRPDGYHEVETILQTVSLQDTLHFEPARSGEISLVSSVPGIPTDDSNLIVRAAIALQARKNISKGVRIHLEKRIPARAGLGGASSNAAIALLGLAQLWDIEVSGPELDEIGSELGADVPFFFRGGCAVAPGTGTSVSLLPDSKQQQLLVITPGAEVSTAAAYAAFDSATLTTKGTESILSISRAAAFSGDFYQRLERDHLHNDFEKVIFDIEPEIERASRSLAEAGATGVLLAGSGSSVFGIFENQEARQSALQMAQWDTAWQIFPCVTLSREEYLPALGHSGIPLIRSFNLQSDTGA
jgi:4-diphosphocytidyl-2-C-methyl-D-erythritol kinase